MLWTDLRAAVRAWRRAPGFAAVAIVTLALGIGANTAMFSAFHALALRPLAVADPEHLVLLSAHDATGQSIRPTHLTTWNDLAARQQSLEGLEAYSGGFFWTVEINGRFLSVIGDGVSAGLHSLLGVRPAIGRLLEPADVPRIGEPVAAVVLSHDFWQRAFNGRPGVLGETLRVRGLPLTVVGVTEPGFTGLRRDAGFDIAVPVTLVRHLSAAPTAPLRAQNLIGRLRPGVSRETAGAELRALWPAVQSANLPPGLRPAEEKDFLTQTLQVTSASGGLSNLRTRYADALRLLTMLTAVLLLMAAVNLSVLYLARAAAREQETAVCVALGAGRRQVVQQMLTETLLLTAAGAALGLPLAWLATDWLLQTMSLTLTLPPVLELTPDGRVLAVAMAVTVGTALLVAALPAWSAWKVQPAEALRQGRTVARTASRWGRPLLAVQVALSLVLLFEAALLTQTLARLEETDLGFPRSGVLALRVSEQPGAYSSYDRAAYYPELVQRLQALPGVQAVALNKLFPWVVAEGNLFEQVAPAGADGTDSAGALLEVISPGFFAAAGVPMVGGRDFTWQDDADGAPVVMVNAALARALFPGQNAIGREIRVGNHPQRQALTIVGVAADASLGSVRITAQPIAYRPWLQEPAVGRLPSIIVRAAQPRALTESVKRTLESMGVEHLLVARTLEEQIASAIAPERIAAVLSMWFGGLAAVLAVLGLYGVIAHGVARRSREIGLRVALGASRWSTVGTVVRDAAWLVLAGIGLGIPLALNASRSTASLLFGVTASDTVLLSVTAALLVAAGLLSAVLPAYRAARLDPMTALRAE